MDKVEFHPGASILCAGCNGEFHASENDGPVDRPFRCRTCRQRKIDEVRLAHPELFDGSKRTNQGEVADRDIQDQPASTRSGKGRAAKVQQKPDERTS